jgi:hypothetical protein
MAKFIAHISTGNRGPKQKPEIYTRELDLTFKPNKQGEYELDMKYGLSAHYVECTAKDPGRPVEHYRIHRSITPPFIKKLVHEKSGRVFELRNHQGFINYTMDLVEVATEKRVAIIRYEEYYKD